MKHIYILLLLWVFSCSSPSHEYTHLNQYDEIVNAYFYDGPGHAISIRKDGKIIYEKAVGLANIKTGDTLSTDHIFNIGSLSKQFTAIAILKLAESKKLSLEDPIIKWLPECTKWGTEIQIQHLLSHTAGIPSYTSNKKWDAQKKSSITVDSLITFFKDEDLDFNAGSQFRYSNSGYILLGKIIEIISEQKYDSFLKTTIFDPLNLKHTSLFRNVLNDKIPIGYAVDEKGSYAQAQEVHISQTHASGALNSNLEDLQKWNQAIFENNFVSDEFLELAHQQFSLSDNSISPYGFGWFINHLDNYKIIRHGGEVNGFESEILYIPSKKLSIAILTNSNALSTNSLLKKLTATALGKKTSFPKKISISEEELQIYVGTYELENGEIFYIEIQNNQLIGQGYFLAPTPLIPIQNKIFSIPSLNTKIKFNHKKNKPIQSITIYEDGKHEIARKVK